MSKSVAASVPSKDSEPILGIKVSWEIKLLCIVVVFSILKAFKAFTSHFLFLLFGRCFFIAGHAYFIYVFFFTNYRITKSTSRTTEEKNAARTQCQGVIKGRGERVDVCMGMMFVCVCACCVCAYSCYSTVCVWVWVWVLLMV
ncbi:hypothetical protein EON63_15145 [archaeon]|nr:MAG: hypothetical protein EON63_15145 [archaeon]